MSKENKEITVTLRSPKGTEWQLKTVKSKLNTVKSNARKMGYQIVRVGA